MLRHNISHSYVQTMMLLGGNIITYYVFIQSTDTLQTSWHSAVLSCVGSA